ncbi:MAG: DUF1579 domain-containing protein [Hoeflea sp.]|uniref:DUF1579 domain-containing protein n=1 Tax=Hoeflea sp. TaxID=1940281 RepID=UPI001DC4B764|nr:DUF1579 domain-containing protein [Hoeflea sp.]MBU4530010.1 DUF1579 domain-containing protein [Alphaproteobacteria bacterium]MBU4543237.1 DUF1579 domain-containing protein [Alphaproteobacteria bacterium]MBU4550223.1 DUF1579 domain-containing protein [Alphaproteobacteria bacterium]MBV1722503.1 DUF1579 domain-containing protein [Hoeflea sp.]MBV1761653.1 DUF1579 domain-containing protein [Hoeflea sp.]
MSDTACHDFDFVYGDWKVRHRRLTVRLKGSDEWEEFDGTSSTRPVLGGNGNIEDNWIDFPGGAYRAVALRSYDRAAEVWAIWWLDQRNPHHLDVPVVGRFANGVGTFLADDSFEGRPIKVRFNWVSLATDSCRWEQAFSSDGGLSWETNWIMQFSRVADDQTR